jgi:phosphonate transport system substrate-binding protein
MSKAFSKQISAGLGIILLLTLPGLLWAQNQKTLSFGIVPQQSAARLATLWTPVCRYISERTGQQLVFKTAKDIPTFEQRLAAGEYDIAYMNPYHYTVFSIDPGYRAFARETEKRIRGIVVVRKDSAYQSIGELDGKTLAFPAPAAFAASVLPRAYFKKNGIAITPQYVKSHDSVYLAVSRGIYPAGGGIQRTFDNISEATRAGLRILWTTPGFTPHAFAAHPRLSAATVEALVKVLAAMGRDADGRKLLGNLNFQPIGPARDQDWDDVRGLGIDLLQNLIKGKD